MLTITGDNPAVSAIVAINFAAIAADEARSTLLIDTDAGASTVAAALRFRSSQGLSGLVTQKLSWPEAVRSSRIGRDSAIDVVPSGPDAPPFQAVSALLQSDASRLARRYDTIVLVSAAEQPLNHVLLFVRAWIHILVHRECARPNVIGDPPQPPAVVRLVFVLLAAHLGRR